MPGPGGRAGRRPGLRRAVARLRLRAVPAARPARRAGAGADAGVLGLRVRWPRSSGPTCWSVTPATCGPRRPSRTRWRRSWSGAGGGWRCTGRTRRSTRRSVPGGVYRTPRVLGRFAEVLGGQFLAHPPIAPYTVHVTSPEHPLVAGLRAVRGARRAVRLRAAPAARGAAARAVHRRVPRVRGGARDRRRAASGAVPQAHRAGHRLLLHAGSLPGPVRRAGPRHRRPRPAGLRQLAGAPSSARCWSGAWTGRSPARSRADGRAAGGAARG